MSKCNETIATKLTAETVIGKDCKGNLLYAGNTFASCQDITDTEGLQESIDEALRKANQALAENQNDINRVVFEADNIKFIRRGGTTFNLTAAILKQMLDSQFIDTTELQNAIAGIDLDQAELAIADDNLTLTNEDGTQSAIPLTDLVAWLNNGLVTDAELATAIAGMSFNVAHDASLKGDGTDTNPLGVVFATETEINEGNIINKAVSSREYHKEIRVLNSSVTQVGASAGLVNTGNSQTAIGSVAGYNNTAPNQSVVGVGAGFNNTGSNQSAFGNNAGRDNAGRQQVAFGDNAGYDNAGRQQVAVGSYAGHNNTAFRHTAVGSIAGRNNTGTDTVAIGGWAAQENNITSLVSVGVDTNTFIGESVPITGVDGLVITVPSHGMTVGTTQAITANSGTTTGVVTVTDANTVTLKRSINLVDVAEINTDLNYGKSNVILLGYKTQARQENNHAVIGNSAFANIYTTATYHGAGFVTNSDQRIKQVGDLVSTMSNGIEVRKFTYLSNGTKHIGWVAQQVKTLLAAKGYDEEVISAALPTTKDIDWHATIANFNGETGSNITLWTEAEEVFDAYVLAKARELDVSEETVQAFFDAVDAIQAKYAEDVAYNEQLEDGDTPRELTPVSEWQRTTYDTLKSYRLNNYFVYADDIMGVNKQLVMELLS